MSKTKKTNAMRILDKLQINYGIYEYSTQGRKTTMTVAQHNNLAPGRVFKTLVAQGVSKTFYVFLVPSTMELNLKKAAKESNEKKVEMIPQKNLLPLTGYVHGGCSPIGMKKKLKTFIHEDVGQYSQVVISGGKRGTQIDINSNDLITITQACVVDIGN